MYLQCFGKKGFISCNRYLCSQILMLLCLLFCSLGVILAIDGMACTTARLSTVDMVTRRQFLTQTCMLRPMEPTLSTVTSN